MLSAQTIKSFVSGGCKVVVLQACESETLIKDVEGLLPGSLEVVHVQNEEDATKYFNQQCVFLTTDYEAFINAISLESSGVISFSGELVHVLVSDPDKEYLWNERSIWTLTLNSMKIFIVGDDEVGLDDFDISTEISIMNGLSVDDPRVANILICCSESIASSRVPAFQLLEAIFCNKIPRKSTKWHRAAYDNPTEVDLILKYNEPGMLSGFQFLSPPDTVLQLIKQRDGLIVSEYLPSTIVVVEGDDVTSLPSEVISNAKKNKCVLIRESWIRYGCENGAFGPLGEGVLTYPVSCPFPVITTDDHPRVTIKFVSDKPADFEEKLNHDGVQIVDTIEEADAVLCNRISHIPVPEYARNFSCWTKWMKEEKCHQCDISCFPVVINEENQHVLDNCVFFVLSGSEESINIRAAIQAMGGKVLDKPTKEGGCKVNWLWEAGFSDKLMSKMILLFPQDDFYSIGYIRDIVKFGKERAKKFNHTASEYIMSRWGTNDSGETDIDSLEDHTPSSITSDESIKSIPIEVNRVSTTNDNDNRGVNETTRTIGVEAVCFHDAGDSGSSSGILPPDKGHGDGWQKTTAIDDDTDEKSTDNIDGDNRNKASFSSSSQRKRKPIANDGPCSSKRMAIYVSPKMLVDNTTIRCPTTKTTTELSYDKANNSKCQSEVSNDLQMKKLPFNYTQDAPDYFHYDSDTTTNGNVTEQLSNMLSEHQKKDLLLLEKMLDCNGLNSVMLEVGTQSTFATGIDLTVKNRLALLFVSLKMTFTNEQTLATAIYNNTANHATILNSPVFIGHGAVNIGKESDQNELMNLVIQWMVTLLRDFGIEPTQSTAKAAFQTRVHFWGNLRQAGNVPVASVLAEWKIYQDFRVEIVVYKKLIECIDSLKQCPIRCLCPPVGVICERNAEGCQCPCKKVNCKEAITYKHEYQVSNHCLFVFRCSGDTTKESSLEIRHQSKPHVFKSLKENDIGEINWSSCLKEYGKSIPKEKCMNFYYCLACIQRVKKNETRDYVAFGTVIGDSQTKCATENCNETKEIYILLGELV